MFKNSLCRFFATEGKIKNFIKQKLWKTVQRVQKIMNLQKSKRFHYLSKTLAKTSNFVEGCPFSNCSDKIFKSLILTREKLFLILTWRIFLIFWQNIIGLKKDIFLKGEIRFSKRGRLELELKLWTKIHPFSKNKLLSRALIRWKMEVFGSWKNWRNCWTRTIEIWRLLKWRKNITYRLRQKINLEEIRIFFFFIFSYPFHETLKPSFPNWENIFEISLTCSWTPTRLHSIRLHFQKGYFLSNLFVISSFRVPHAYWIELFWV